VVQLYYVLLTFREARRNSNKRDKICEVSSSRGSTKVSHFSISVVLVHCVYIAQNAADTYRNVNELGRMANPINRFLLVTGPNRILE